MSKNIQIITIAFGILISCVASAQDLLTIDEAVAIAIENNYDIRIASNNISKAENEHHRGNAGMLPEVTMNGSYNTSTGSVTQETFSGQSATINGAGRTNASLGLQVKQTLFDGMIMFRTYDKLGQNVQLQNLKKQEEIENMTTQVMAAYYDVIVAEENLTLLTQSIDYGNEQYDVIKKRKDAGRATLIDVLNNEVSLAEDSTRLLDAQTLVKQKRSYLSFLLGGKLQENALLDNQLLVNETIIDSLGEFKTENNILVKQANTNMSITELDYQIYKGAKMPQLFASVGYDLNNSVSDFGFASQTTSNTFNAGITASWTIFQGFKRDIQMQSVRIDQLNQEVSKEKIEQNLNKDFSDAKIAFEAALEKIKLYERNLKLYEKQYELTKQLYELGRSTSLEMRQAQEQLFGAKNKLFVVQKEAKVQEVELLRLNGKLVSF